MTSGSLVEPVDDPRCFYVLCHSIRLIFYRISCQSSFPSFFLRLIRFIRIVFPKISVLSLESFESRDNCKKKKQEGSELLWKKIRTIEIIVIQGMELALYLIRREKLDASGIRCN